MKITDKLLDAFCESYNLSKDDEQEFFSLISTQYFTPEVQSLSQYEQHLDINRLQHITSVTYLAYKISKHFGCDAASACRAAVMHDLFYYDWRDGETGKWHKLHGYKHPKYAALNAKELCPSLTKKEEDIIRRHMWPLTVLTPNSKEGFIVSLSDKYCATVELFYSMLPSFKAKIDERIKPR